MFIKYTYNTFSKTQLNGKTNINKKIIFEINCPVMLKFVFIINLLLIFINLNHINASLKNNQSIQKCYVSPTNTDLKIIHLIITRFMIEFWPGGDFKHKIYTKDYLLNGLRVMKKYLFPSLENQSCKKFIWVLKIGDKSNKTLIKTLMDFALDFEKEIIYERDIKEYIKNKTYGCDVLITSRIDYDDRIYYDAVNDVRKYININKPMFLHGYNRGVHYYESNDKYYELNADYKNRGVKSIFVSLIVILDKVNGTYNIFDLGSHTSCRETLLNSYKSFGIKKLDYEPSNFDNGDIKFVWVRHNFSGLFKYSVKVEKSLKDYDFNLSKFYGK